MFRKKMLFIYNPCSGKGQIKNRLVDILGVFEENDYDVMIHPTRKSLDAVRTIERIGKEFDLIVCAGGDGTLNETVTGVLREDLKIPIGYIPSGTTNDFASSLKIPKNMISAAEAAVTGTGFSIDIGHFCEDRYFVYIAAFGAFTEVSYMTPQERKNILGHQAYMLEGVKSLTAMKTYHMTVSCEEIELTGEFIFGMITNTVSVGGFKGLVTQDVALDDGEFEVLLIRAPKTPLDFSNIVSYMFLKEEDNEYVHKFRTHSLYIRSEEETGWVLDGEYGGLHREVHLENLQKTVEIRRNMLKSDGH